MTDVSERESSQEWLMKYGAKWAVLQALQIDLAKKSVALPPETSKELEKARIEIQSGCYSVCEVDCALNRVEAELVSLASAFGDDYFENWTRLLAIAMRGQLTFERIEQIPVLKPVASECRILKCSCSG